MVRKKDDVVVVGASVAGLFAAYKLARAGVPVQVYEAQGAFAPAARTLIVTPAWLRLLDFDVSDAVLNRTDTFELISRGAAARIPLREPDVILERAAFLRILARQARAAGVEIVFEHRFRDLTPRDPAHLLRFRNGGGGREAERRAASAVLGADGVHSAVARSTGGASLERVAILQAQVALPPDLAPNTVRVWFDRARTRFFYWLIPESPHTGVAGLIADTPAQAQRALDAFLAAHDLTPMTRQAAEVPLHPLRYAAPSHLGREANGRGPVLLVGDAAGQVKVSTVGGVVTGMRAADAAVRSILHGTSYADELGPLQRELNFHALARRVLDGFTDEDYERLLGSLNERAVSVLRRYNRDELSRAIWRLLPAQPRWLLLGARALVRGFRSPDARPGSAGEGED